MESMLWQTTFVMRALSPLYLNHAFRRLRLLIHLGDDDLQLNNRSSSSDDHLLDTLCLTLLEAAARTSSALSPFCVAFPESPTSISVVFPATRKLEVEQMVELELASFPEMKINAMADDEIICSGLLLDNAFSSGLAATFVCDGWTVFDGNLVVLGGIMEWIDGAPTEAFRFAVHTSTLHDGIDFLFLPDVIRFRRFKIERFLCGPLKGFFDSGPTVLLDNYLENMSPDDTHELNCLTIPSMKEGLVSGWDFFNSGKLQLKFICPKGTQKLCWTTAHSTLQASRIILNDNIFDLDSTFKMHNFDSEILQNFRRSKLPPSYFGVRESMGPSISDLHGVDDSIISGHSGSSIKPVVTSVPTNLGVPIFSKRKIRDVQTATAVKANDPRCQKENLKIRMDQGKGNRPRGSIAGDAVFSLPKKRRVCAKQEKSANQKNLQKANTQLLSDGNSLLNKKAPDFCESSTQKQNVKHPEIGSVLIKPAASVKLPLQDTFSHAHGPNRQREQQTSSKMKDARMAHKGEKKSAQQEKKSIDLEANHKKVVSKHASGKLGDLTVPELKLFLSANKSKVSGKKEELVHRVLLILSSLKPP